MGKKSTPKPPDYTDLIAGSKEVAQMNADAQRENLAWAREQDTKNRATLERVLGVQLPIMEEQFANAQEDRQRYEQTYLPIEQNLIQEFQNYGSPERMEQERGRAIADVNTSFDAQRRNALSRLESYGIDPSQTRNQALDLGMRIQQAASSAGAANAATQRVENTGRALRAEAINIGRGLPSQVAQSYGQSVAAGQAGVGGANQTTGTSSGAFTGSTAFGNAALSGYGSAGNLMNTGFQNGMDVANFNQAQTGMWLDVAGSLGGAAIGRMEEGGIVPEEGALPISPIPGSTDRKPILATPGEAVVDLDTTRWYGEKFFADLKKKASEQRMALEIQKRQPQGAIPMGA
jgi:hypothetical protein